MIDDGGKRFAGGVWGERSGEGLKRSEVGSERKWRMDR